ncbi:MAG: hypothetical protein CME62_17990 [Halobacteriovoraceae bacterium]|nr:hypothetical protein [Halobacteriovoraceae bacterium]|tara:strand:+ start:13322 stop:13657 length:336 start_codon:yes stop_codon:yes gene_type:complete
MKRNMMLILTMSLLLTGCWGQIENSALVSCKFNYQGQNDYLKICYQGVRYARGLSERNLNFRSSERDVIELTYQAESHCSNTDEPHICEFGVGLFREHAIDNWNQSRYFKF